MIPQPPTTFNAPAHAGRWYPWGDIAKCFWPGRGRRAVHVNATLAEVRHLGGVYLLAWSKESPENPSPIEAAVRYVGETGCFSRRMQDFGNSAGFWNCRSKGHSASWRWPEGSNDYLWIAFFPIGNNLPGHLAEGMRRWMEGVAIEEHRTVQGDIPRLNRNEKKVITLT